MSYQYDRYLVQHKSNVEAGFRWLQKNLPEITEESGAEHNIIFEHDQSKMESDEYEAYDAYFYGGNRSYAIVDDFRKAWLLHIHRNPHHWQHWVLINDDPEEGENVLEMPYCYILEMICDWWSFSWQKRNLFEIFVWYDEHRDYIKIHPNTRKTVEDILYRIKGRLGDSSILSHHGVKGMKWGVRNGPPYPIEKVEDNSTIVKDAIDSGQISKTINQEKQRRHTKSEHTPGRSYLDGDIEFAQNLVDEYGGKGTPICAGKTRQWNHRERITADQDIGVYVDTEGNETRSNKAMIVYSKTGTHIYPVRKEDSDEN